MIINTAMTDITIRIPNNINPIAQSRINAMTTDSTNMSGTGSTSMNVLISAV